MSTNEHLADNVRNLLINKASRTGAHLASNLGIVELTIALTQTFDFTKDTIVFDIGHQSHPYKILTDRESLFATLGDRDGISNFPDIKESVYDHYNTGHSGTAVSAALGYAISRPQRHHIAVIGDGALTSGETFEALNHAGSMQIPLLVVLNDNQMSISPNMGSLNYSERVKGFAESLGFQYIGIEDGHSIAKLTEILLKIKTIRHPIFFHVRTIKGKGYGPAELDPEAFHWTPPFEIADGNPLWSFSSPFLPVLSRLADHWIEEYPETYFTTPAYQYLFLNEIARKHPGHVIDCGIAEQHCVTFSSALAMSGSRVVMHLSEWFLPRCCDQLIDVCIQEIPIVFLLSFGGIGTNGPTHDGRYTFPFLKTIPGLTLLHPANANEFGEMLDYAVIIKKPVFIRVPDFETPLGDNYTFRPELPSVVSCGNRMTILTIGGFLGKAEEISKRFEGVEVIHLGTILPLNVLPICESVAKTGRLLILENGFMDGGIGQSVKCDILERLPNARVSLLAGRKNFVRHGTFEEILEDNGLSDKHIFDAITNLFGQERLENNNE